MVLNRVIAENAPELAHALSRGQLYWTRLPDAEGVERRVIVVADNRVGGFAGEQDVFLVMEDAVSFQITRGRMDLADLARLAGDGE
jgi:hypothetical protein